MILMKIDNVCAQAPPGIDAYADLLIGWAKYGVAALIIAAGFISIGAMVIGKLGGMGRAAQVGASGLVYSIVGAVLYVTIYGILWAIVGKGC